MYNCYGNRRKLDSVLSFSELRSLLWGTVAFKTGHQLPSNDKEIDKTIGLFPQETAWYSL